MSALAQYYQAYPVTTVAVLVFLGLFAIAFVSIAVIIVIKE